MVSSTVTYLIIIALCFFLAKRDGTTYLMHGKPRNYLDRLKWWHVEGAIIYCLACSSLVKDWATAAFVLLIRLGLYDIVYNAYAKFPIGYIGGEAFTDMVTKRIFKNAVIKGWVCLVAIILLIIFK